MNRIAPLGVLFGVLLVAVVWREASRGSSRTLVEEADLRPLQAKAFTPDDVTKVEVTGPGGMQPAYTLVREDKSWRVVSDFKAPASGANVTKFLETLAKAEGEFRTKEEAALEEFDLTPAKAVDVKAFDKDGNALVHLAIGKSSGSNGAFVRNLASDADATKAFAVTANVRGLMGLGRSSVGEHEPEKPAADFFHDKEFPALRIDKPKALVLDAPGRHVEFENAKKDPKDPKGEWKVAKGGLEDPVKKDGPDGAVRALNGGFRPTGLVDPAKRKELGFDAPKYRIAVTTEDGTTRAAVGSTDAKCEHYYVRLDAEQALDVLYEASEYEFHQLFPRGPSLFDIKFPEVKDTDLGTFEVAWSKDGAARSISMTRTGTKPTDDWTLTNPGRPFTAKQSALRALAGTLKTLKPVDYVDPGVDCAPKIRVAYGPPGTKAEDLKSVVIGDASPDGKDRLMMVLPGKHAWVVAQSTVDRLAPEPMSVVESKPLFGWTADDVTSVRVEGGSPEFAPQYELTKDADGWKIGGKPADAAAAQAFVAKLLALDATTTRAGEDGAKLDARVVVSGTKGEPVTVLVLPAEKDRRFGRVAGVEFELPSGEFVPAAASFEPKAAPAPKKDETPVPPK